MKPLRKAARAGLEAGGSADPRLLIRAVRLARSVEQGRHGTADRGDSTEFYDHRPYEAGDPLASVDWRLFGRTDRHYVRRFRHDARLTVTLVLDASASMDFAGGGAVTKLERGVELGAAALALGARQGDRVGAAVVGGERGGVRMVPAAPGRGGLVRAIAALGVTKPGAVGARAGADGASPGPLASGLARVLGASDAGVRRGVFVLVGDAFEPVDALGRALAMAGSRGATVVLVRTLTPAETPGGVASGVSYVDPETGARARSGAFASEALRAHDGALTRVSRRLGVRLVGAMTDADPLVALREAFVGGGVR
ncbi:MAG: DUF58 domain-containing protein [Planctomycetota bacterium]